MNLHNKLGPQIEEEVKKVSGSAGIVLRDLADGECYSLGKSEVFPIASIIKLTILWELFARIDRGEIQVSEKRQLLDSVKVGGFGILKNLDEGLDLTIHDLATLMITLSDNVATNMLIDELGMDSINKKVRELGLIHTQLKRKMMDSKAKEEGLDNFSSPEDVALILENYVNSDALSLASRQAMLEILKKQQ